VVAVAIHVGRRSPAPYQQVRWTQPGNVVLRAEAPARDMSAESLTCADDIHY
jgi:hypothetical protein